MSLRNIAIIAHVDHGKTTLVDELLKQSGTYQAHEEVQERVMDSNDLEKERGITILAKTTSIMHGDIKINIVDTPGHADFGGEVERILSMVDGVILLVDAAEGPMPQTKFVTNKALNLGLKPIVVINKFDKPDARHEWVVDQVFDLFVNLNATDEQLDFPVIYASAKNGWAIENPEDEQINMDCLINLICEKVEEPKCDTNAEFKMLATTIEYDNFLGRILNGRIESGTVKVGDKVIGLNKDGVIENAKITKILEFKGLEKKPVEQGFAGDIVSIAGMTKTTVADTICAPDVKEAIESLPITPPTMSMTFGVNDSPICGNEGKKLTGNMIRERLEKEAEINIAIKVTQTEDKDSFDVAGRGELLLGVLIENMRREGFELTVGPPRVIIKEDENGQKIEPLEEVQIDVDEEYSGTVIEKLSLRKAELKGMEPSGAGKTKITLEMPARGLIGYQSEFLSDTRGTGIMARSFVGYTPYKGAIEKRREGVLISSEQGKAIAYALAGLEDRGPLFIEPGDDVYTGMIIGEHNKGNDLDVNPLKGKQLTNVRASGKDDAVKLTPPRKFTLEAAIAYLGEDERLEVTPSNIRLRKQYLNPSDRKRAKKV